MALAAAPSAAGGAPPLEDRRVVLGDGTPFATEAGILPVDTAVFDLPGLAQLRLHDGRLVHDRQPDLEGI
ncbi:MAG: hypothetical protein GIW95_10460 [Candidatus Eremiobacteraeota bacterium]|nr:hypothetical protein [Candidatus Eremiobacteraeota bacterium]